MLKAMIVRQDDNFIKKKPRPVPVVHFVTPATVQL
jgi:hypothetical protein